MKRILIGVLVFVVYLACVVMAAFALHFSGTKFALFCMLLGLLGGATIAFAIWYISRTSGKAAQAGGSDSINLQALLRDADRKLRTSHLGVKSLAAAQIIYMVGADNSAKTQTVLQCGLDAELLAGNLFRDGVVAPTQLVNIWLAGSSVIVEAGSSLLQQPALWQRLIKATQPGKVGSLFAKTASQSPRAVVVCVSAERIPGPSEPGYNANEIRTSAQTLNERLRQLSQTLGISVPVYVLFTKLDTLAHFADYVGRLSPEEVKAPLGSLVAQVETGSGLYAERASALVSTRLDELTYALSAFRLEVLSRGGELKMLASAYEFPRDLQKRRNTIVDFLVELTRPSQLGINPFLRGFFFSGMRAVMVDDVAAAPVQPQPSAPVDAGATRVFSLGESPVNQPQQPARSGSRKVPQWAFLPHLFSRLLLNDKSALEASRASTGVNVLKRVLLACACSCIFVYVVLLTISFFNNRDLEEQEAAAAAVTVNRPAPNQFASVHDLQTLDQLGAVLLKLDSYRKEGPPMMYRWGLYSGNALYPIACNAYSNKFQALLLGPAQSNILAQLRALQTPPPAGADYNATYNPLKAYLISTSHHEKSATDPTFLAPVLTSSWAGAGAAPSDLASLAQTQFQTYATLLAEPQSCLASTGGRPDRATVDHAREYLNNGFGGFQHVYRNMLADAGKAPSLRFNDKFAGSSRYIVDSYEVPGAFTKAGFTFMQGAIQHPEPYYSGEEWVLGPMAGSMPDRATLITQLQKQYIADYLSTWRAYLNAARFVGFQSWNDAAGKLSALDSNSSAILQLFYLISTNTGVTQSDIVNAFQAPQSVVPSNSPDNRFIAPANQPYIQALQGLEQSVKILNANSLNANDPTATVQQAALAAEQAAKAISNNFNRDPDFKMDAVSFDRLDDPIKSVLALAQGAPAAAAGGGAKAFCDQAKDVLTEFPFNPQSTVDTTPDQAASIFSPGRALDQLTGKLSQLIVLQGGQYVRNPASKVAINPDFLRFLNTAKKVQTDLFQTGESPNLTFSLTEVKNPGAPVAVLTIDGQQLTVAGQATPFHWAGTPGSRVTLISDQSTWTGEWSVFKFGFSSNSTSHSPSGRLEYQFPGEISRVVQFDADGPGAPLLNPSFMKNLACVTRVGK